MTSTTTTTTTTKIPDSNNSNKVSRTSYDHSTVKQTAASTSAPILTSATATATTTTTKTTPISKLKSISTSTLSTKNNDVDSMLPSLSSKLNSLSLEERSHGLHDLHGVSDLEIETPQMIQQKLQELNLTLNNMINTTTTTTTTTSDASSSSSPQSQQQNYMFGNSSSNNNSKYNQKETRTTTTSPTSKSFFSFPNSEATTTATNTNISTNIATINTTAADINTYAFKHAMNENSNYVDKFKLPCLRADRFNVSKAAIRMIRYFHRKYQLFGLETLTKDITMADLTQDDRHALQNGLIQLLPQKDRSGRTIMILFGKLSPNYTTDTVLRVFFYMSHVAIFQDYCNDNDNENDTSDNNNNSSSNNNNIINDSQRRGFVMIYYGVGPTKFIRGRAMELLRTWLATPMKIVAGHFCSDNPVLHPFIKFFFTAMENRMFCRFRCHFGTNMECMYNLMTFGIPKQLLPISDDDNNNNNDNDNKDGYSIELTIHHQLLAVLKRREEAKEIPTMVQEYHYYYSDEDDDDDNYDDKDEEESGNDSDKKGKKSQRENITTSTNDYEDEDEDIGDVKFDESGFPITDSKSMATTTDTATAPPTAASPTATCKTSKQGKNRKKKKILISSTAKRAILIPGPMDLVMGRRGRHAKNAPGALRMKHLLEEYRQQYDASSKIEKTVLADIVLLKMKESGCRFLKSTPQGWIECDDLVARKRLAHAFRNLRGKQQEEVGGGGGGARKGKKTTSAGSSSDEERKGEKRNLDVSTAIPSSSYQ